LSEARRVAAAEVTPAILAPKARKKRKNKVKYKDQILVNIDYGRYAIPTTTLKS
jgi:hypothetical protein